MIDFMLTIFLAIIEYFYNSSFNNQIFMVTQYRIFPFTAILKMNYSF